MEEPKTGVEAIARYRMVAERIRRQQSNSKAEPVSEPACSAEQLLMMLVSDKYGVPLDVLYSNLRTPRIVEARHLVMYIARTVLGHSFPRIAQELGGKHHSTVMHGVETVQLRLKTEPSLGARISDLENEFRKRYTVK